MALPSPSLVISVRCLGCGARYTKPVGGGTMRANPGCPNCGYIGWSTDDDLNGEPRPSRPVLDRRPVRSSRSR